MCALAIAAMFRHFASQQQQQKHTRNRHHFENRIPNRNHTHTGTQYSCCLKESYRIVVIIASTV
jgi:hypothetical protein